MSGIDFYTNIHKALRRELFNVSVLAGSTDVSDPEALARLRAAFTEVAALLRDHARHEDDFLHPVLGLHVPDELPPLESEHAELEHRLDELEHQLSRLETAEPESHTAGLGFYRALNRYISDYLAHQDREESDVQPRLWACESQGDLGAMMGRFVAALAPHDILRNAAYMLPALSPAERAAHLSKLQRSTSPELFEQIQERLAATSLAGAR
ncbi:hemerythrin domain-containing protein [bacterium]|nr:hemerythrin domain-containing protein [bacterium]